LELYSNIDIEGQYWKGTILEAEMIRSAISCAEEVKA